MLDVKDVKALLREGWSLAKVGEWKYIASKTRSGFKTFYEVYLTKDAQEFLSKFYKKIDEEIKREYM